MVHKVSNYQNSLNKYKITLYENKTLNEFRDISLQKSKEDQAYKDIYKIYTANKKSLAMRKYRVVPYVFHQIKLNWLVMTMFDEEKKINNLVGHSVTCYIYWNGTIDGLPPNGWSGSTMRCYENNFQKEKINTICALYVEVSKNYRYKKLSKKLIEEIKNLAIKKKYLLIIPLRPLLRYEKEFCSMPFSNFCKLKREDGLAKDVWLRIHERLNAKRLTLCETSHQHKMSISSFYNLFGNHNMNKTGHYVVNIMAEWYNVYVNVEYDTVTVTQGCVWVEYEQSQRDEI